MESKIVNKHMNILKINSLLRDFNSTICLYIWIKNGTLNSQRIPCGPIRYPCA